MIAGNAIHRTTRLVWEITQGKIQRTPSACEGTDLANRGGQAVILATSGSRCRLGGKETKAVTRAELTEAQKDSINHCEGTDVMLQLDVETAHDEADDGLQYQTEDLPVNQEPSVDVSRWISEGKRTIVCLGPR